MSTTARTIDPEHQMLGEVEMVGRDRWEEIRRRAGAGASIRAIARGLGAEQRTMKKSGVRRGVLVYKSPDAAGKMKISVLRRRRRNHLEERDSRA